MDIYCIFIKLLVIFVLLLIFYKLYKQYDSEGFENIDYIKLSETYIEPNSSKSKKNNTLDILYTNYDGDDFGKDMWENKTLEQCTDVCNQLDNCIGFSRDLVNDDATSSCYPRTYVSNCHSNRKGNTLQMQNAIKYNSYIKTNNTNTNTILTKCIGDTKLTLNKTIFIKSHLYPTKYIGTLGDGLIMLIDINDPEINKKCNFRIEIGKDGSGTVSFLHIDTNMYLYRNTNTKANNTKENNTKANNTKEKTVVQKDILILKDITSNKTNDKQRVSFNILDGMKNLMRFKCLQLDGETTDKFIVINPDNKNYVACMEYNSKDVQQYTFNIIDNIIKSKVITNTLELPKKQLHTTQPQNAKQFTNNNAKKEAFMQTDVIGNSIVSNNTPDNLLNLDTSENIPLYNNLFTNPNNIQNYISDNYNSDDGNSANNTFVTISKKMNDIIIDKQLTSSLTKHKDEYDAINTINLEIENEIANLNMGLNAKNDKIYNNIDKMRISDMAHDYFSLKNIKQTSYE